MGSPTFNSSELELLESAGRYVRYPVGSFLWHELDEARYLFVILSGHVRIIQTMNGRQHVVHLSGPGETIGEVPLFDGGGYPAAAAVSEETVCLIVDRAALMTLLDRYPKLASKLLVSLSKRIRHLVKRLQWQTTGTVRSRLAASLLGAAMMAQDDVVDMGTQAAWAEDIGTVRESLARELSTLRKDRILERAGRTSYRILDEIRLEREARVA